jgi:hypothetical protein
MFSQGFLCIVRESFLQGRREAINIGGGCRRVLTNISDDFDRVVKNFPKNVVDGWGGGGGKLKNFPDYHKHRQNNFFGLT